MTLKTVALAGLIIMGGALKAYAADRSYDAAGFDKIEVSSGITAEVAVGGDFRVAADARRGDIDRLVVEVRGDTLHISREVGWGFLGGGKRDRFHVTIALPTLQAIAGNAGATVTVDDATMALRTAEASSGASLRIDGTLGDLSLEATSGSSLHASGTCRTLQAHASSGAHLRADDLRCSDADLHGSSGASLRAYAGQSAEVHASSGASVRVDGGADVTQREVSSGGSVRIN